MRPGADCIRMPKSNSYAPDMLQIRWGLVFGGWVVGWLGFGFWCLVVKPTRVHLSLQLQQQLQQQQELQLGIFGLRITFALRQLANFHSSTLFANESQKGRKPRMFAAQISQQVSQPASQPTSYPASKKMGTFNSIPGNAFWYMPGIGE